MEDAKQNAASSTSAILFNYMWMVGLRDDGKVSDKQLDRSKEDAERRKPLDESTFMEEMKKAKNRGNLGLVIGLVGVVVGLVCLV